MPETKINHDHCVKIKIIENLTLIESNCVNEPDQSINVFKTKR